MAMRRFESATPRAWLTAMLACAIACANASSAHPTDAMPPDGQRASAQFVRASEHMPLRFEENRGQFHAAVRYVSRQSGGAVFLTNTGAVMSFASSARAVRMAFGNSEAAPIVGGEDALQTRTRYYIGNDPHDWHADVPSFSHVRYRDVYPGIDVVYHGNGSQLEYDFELAPEANPDVIALSFDGAERIDIDGDGDLVLRATPGDLRQKKPIAYQAIDGSRRPVAARYVRHGNEIGIALGRYDHRHALTIDPIVVLTATYLGGSDTDKVLGVAADAAGNTYVAGLTQSIDFPTVNPIQSAEIRLD